LTDDNVLSLNSAHWCARVYMVLHRRIWQTCLVSKAVGHYHHSAASRQLSHLLTIRDLSDFPAAYGKLLSVSCDLLT